MDWDGLKIHLHIFDEQRKHIEFINVGGSDTRLRKPDLQTSTGSSPDEGRHARLSHGPVGWCQSGMEENFDPIISIIWVWVNTYRYIFSGMNIHLPAILGFTRYQGFDPSPYLIIIIESYKNRFRGVNSSCLTGVPPSWVYCLKNPSSPCKACWDIGTGWCFQKYCIPISLPNIDYHK